MYLPSPANRARLVNSIANFLADSKTSVLSADCLHLQLVLPYFNKRFHKTNRLVLQTACSFFRNLQKSCNPIRIFHAFLLPFDQSPVHNLIHQGIFMRPADRNSFTGDAHFIAFDEIYFIDGDDKGFVHFNEMRSRQKCFHIF